MNNNKTTIALLGCVLTAAFAACDGAGPPVAPTCADPPADPSGVTIVVNEVMASNVLSKKDRNGDPSDWLELYNPGDVAVSLCGFGLTDDLTKPNKGYLGEDAVIAPGGHLLVWLSGRSSAGGEHHVPFKLAKTGGEIGLSHPDGGFVARLHYAEQATDLSVAREPDGSDHWVIEWHPSPGAANPEGPGDVVGPHDPSTEPEQVPGAGDISERILGYDVLLEIGIRIEPQQVAKLLNDPRTYVPGYLTVDEREYGPVGIRLKGQNSFAPFDQKPSFRINVDEYVDNAKFFGMDDLTLNNMHGDFSMMHERLAYLVARQIGPASRCNHAVVTVNGQNYGLYSNVETVKHHLLARWFDDATGPLFEATDVDFSSQYVDQYELESGPDDRSKLSALASALTNTDPESAIAAASAHVNMEGLLNFWAMEAVIGQFDAFPYSDPGDDYFVYVDPTTRQIWFLPWGMDETFYAAEHDVTQITSRLATTCLAAPSCHQAFVAHVWSVLALTESFDLVAERDRVAAQIAPHVAADRRKSYPDDMVSEFQMQLYWFLSGRRVTLEAILGPEPE